MAESNKDSEQREEGESPTSGQDAHDGHAEGAERDAAAEEAKSAPAERSEEPAEPSPGSNRHAKDPHAKDGAKDEGPAWLPLAIALALPVLFFFVLPPLTRSGLWDPHELNVADMARRLALSLHGAGNLALDGADNTLPYLNDLGRPQLPFTSIALGFKFFGLHEWAGRAPLALWGVLGVLATYGFVSRLVDRRAGVFSAVALTTMPLYFVEARTMLGDIVTMSSLAMAFGGLAVATFGHREEDANDLRTRFAWLALGLAGLVAGLFSRGVLVGLAVPAGAVGLAYLVAIANGQRFDRLSNGVGVLGALLGAGAGAVGASAMTMSAVSEKVAAVASSAPASPISSGLAFAIAVPTTAAGVAYFFSFVNGRRFSAVAHAVCAATLLLGLVMGAYGLYLVTISQGTDAIVPLAGAAFRPPTKYPTFEMTIGHVASALAPWSAFVPFAFGRLFTSPVGVSPQAYGRESQARLALLIGATVAFVAHGWLAMRTDLVAFAGPAILAAGCGIALRDYERGAHPSVAVGVGTAVLLGLIHHEMHKTPEKAFQAFAVNGATFPESFKNHSLAIWTIVLVGFAGIAFLTWVEHVSEDARDGSGRNPFDPKLYLRTLLDLRDAWDGMLALAYFALVAGASLAGLAVWLGTRQHWKWMPSLSSQMRDVVLNAWWVTAFVPLAVIFGVYFWSDVWVWAFNRARPFAFGRSATRGFEPFEELATRLKEGRLGETLPKLITGKLVVTHEKLDDGIGPISALVLAPLMYLHVPVAVFLVLHFKAGLRPLVAGALAIPAGVALFLLLGLLGDLFRGSRAALLTVFGATVGGILCFSYYPALANQLSPKEIFESYQRTHKGNEPLALFGVGGRTAAYYAGGQPLILKDTASAYDWLMGADPGTRRFLAVRAEEISRLNRTYRERAGTKENLPVLDARSSQIVLVASSLVDGEKNQNPLAKILLSSPPKPQRKLEVNMEDKLEVLGIDVTDMNGKLVETVSPGKKYHLKTYYKVLAPITTEWEAFIHIDGFHKRHNGDHKVCEGKYPMSLWLPDDYVMDDHEFTLEPNFSPGPYTIWFGFYAGESRLKVKSGAADGDNRVNGGVLRVQ